MILDVHGCLCGDLGRCEVVVVRHGGGRRGKGGLEVALGSLARAVAKVGRRGRLLFQVAQR
jgi:hypothetical protein